MPSAFLWDYSASIELVNSGASAIKPVLTLCFANIRCTDMTIDSSQACAPLIYGKCDFRLIFREVRRRFINFISLIRQFLMT